MNARPFPFLRWRTLWSVVKWVFLIGGLVSCTSGLTCQTSKSNTAKVDLQPFLEAKSPLVVINILSVNASATSGLTPEWLDAQLASGIACYQVTIEDAQRTRKICRELADTVFLPSSKPSMDLRYRIDFHDDAGLVKKVYADRFGAVVIDGRLYEPEEKKNWIREVLISVCSEIHV